MRKAFVVIVDLDDNHEEEDGTKVARKALKLLLNLHLGRYNPMVSLAPIELQPGYENHAMPEPYKMGVVDPEALRFADREGATNLYRHLKRLIDVHYDATIADVYRKTGKKVHYTDHYWGWTKLEGFHVELKDGFQQLVLPNPKHLTETNDEGNKAE